jgi:3-mercaptopyruvate sulfurtransferase SseA
MNAEKIMRQEVKKYIDTADVKVVKMMHAMLEIDADNGTWDSIPDAIKIDIDAALEESKKGIVTPHAEIKKRYQKWIVK